MMSTEEHEALAAFARALGRTWRRELAKRWENGTLLLSQVPVSEAQLAALVRLKGKLGLLRYKPPARVAADPSIQAANAASTRRRPESQGTRSGG